MSGKLTVLVTGATGQQGGGATRELLARGHKVRALTRNPSGDVAGRLARAGAEVLAGDFSEPGSVARAAEGVDTVFLMGTPWANGGPALEAEQGIAAVDALTKARPGHVIYASVGSADQGTGIPHFDSKYRVEERLAGSGLPFTIYRPAAFMENLVAPWSIGPLRDGVLVLALPAKRRLQQIAAADIGAFVSVLAERREAVFGRRIDIAGDEPTGEEAAAILSEASGRPIRYQEVPLDVVRQQNPEAAIMFEWFDRVGYHADIPAIRREFPEVKWRGFADWARGFDWSVLSRAA